MTELKYRLDNQTALFKASYQAELQEFQQKIDTEILK